MFDGESINNQIGSESFRLEILKPEEIYYDGEYVKGPQLVEVYDTMSNNNLLRCRFIVYDLAKPWRELQGLDYRGDLMTTTHKGLDMLRHIDVDEPVPVFSVFRGPTEGTPEYIKLALASRGAFPTENGPIQATYLVVPAEKHNARSFRGVLNLIAGVMRTMVANSLEEAVEDMLQSSRSR